MIDGHSSLFQSVMSLSGRRAIAVCCLPFFCFVFARKSGVIFETKAMVSYSGTVVEVSLWKYEC